MLISKQTNIVSNGITISGTQLEKVDRLAYLGNNIYDLLGPTVKITIFVEKARRPLQRCKTFYEVTI